MSKRTLAAGTSPFAHLLAGAAALTRGGRASRAEEEDPKDPDAEDDEEEDDPNAEDQPDDEPEKGRKGRKGKKAEDDEENDPGAEDENTDPNDEDDASAAAEKRGYARAMKRCRAIFSSPASAGRPDLAAYFAFETDLGTKAAIGAMTLSANAPGGQAGGRRSLGDRMGSRNDARPGADTGGSGGASRGGTKLADHMVAVGKRLGQMAKD